MLRVEEIVRLRKKVTLVGGDPPPPSFRDPGKPKTGNVIREAKYMAPRKGVNSSGDHIHSTMSQLVPVCF